MDNATDDERALIAAMQEDTATLKKVLSRLERDSAALVKVNHDAGRALQAADAMVWAGSLRKIDGLLWEAHGAASRALIEGFGDGGEIVARGPGR